MRLSATSVLTQTGLTLSSGLSDRVRGAEEATVARSETINGSLMLMWEDGFCRTRVAECLEDIDGEDPVRKAFSKMSIQLYNYGEGWVLGRTDDAKLLFGSDQGLGNKQQQQPPPQSQNHQLLMPRHVDDSSKAVSESSNLQSHGHRGDNSMGANEPEDYLSLESHSDKARKMENNKFKRSFTLPARMTSSASSSSLDHHHQASTPHAMEYRGSEAGIYSDIMETFLD
ncbi:hypothetical protein J5N97_011136 [Dioscorea zingiberensis]|uniref:Uncharacterized protein n=1 Tax=Dioscorea zingiberensis TaxID=325984 RepID=A0A9D5D019_9LILI|nr:hypothetical protein J5N97_011136 [Dioscorea zingiberensis]